MFKTNSVLPSHSSKVHVNLLMTKQYHKNQINSRRIVDGSVNNAHAGPGDLSQNCD